MGSRMPDIIIALILAAFLQLQIIEPEISCTVDTNGEIFFQPLTAETERCLYGCLTKKVMAEVPSISPRLLNFLIGCLRSGAVVPLSREKYFAIVHWILQIPNM